MNNLNLLIGLLFLLIVVFTLKTLSGTSAEKNRKKGVVSYVIDGDTIVIEASGERLRLYGVDAPEKNETGYQAAKKSLQKLVLEKTIIYQPINTDKYGRTVARVFLRNGQEVNRILIEQGSATEFCKYSKGLYGRC